MDRVERKNFYLRRILAKLIDYMMFFAAIQFFTLLFQVDTFSIYYLLSLFLIPLLFIPFDTFQIYFFSSSIGRRLVGLRILTDQNEKPSFAQSIKASILSGIRSQITLIPLVNIVFGYFTWKKKHSKGKLTHKKTYLLLKKNSPLSFITTLAVSLGLTTCFLFPERVQHGINLITKQEFHFFEPAARKISFDWTGSSWVKVEGNEVSFIAYFPKNPKLITKEIPLPSPSKQDSLPYTEYLHQQDTTKYSVSYTTLPKSWLKWSSGLILNSALKVLMDKSALKKKSSSKCNNYPAIEYQAMKQKTKIYGKLVLVGDTLYKIESAYDIDEQEEDALRFVNSFKPKNA